VTGGACAVRWPAAAMAGVPLVTGMLVTAVLVMRLPVVAVLVPEVPGR